MDARRSERVAEALREELEELITCELTDPRIEVSEVVEVLVSPDGRRARIRLLLRGDGAAQRETLAALGRARGYLKRELARRLDIFRLPELQFEAAIPAELGPRIEGLLRRVRRGRPRAQEAGESASEAASE
jgi:ribosome-binding factor A